MSPAKPGSEQQSRRRQSGSVAIEFAFALLLLFPLVIGTVELGMAVYQNMQVHAAAEAGALYALANGWDEPGITSAVEHAFGVTPTNQVTGVTAIPAPSHFCGCPNGSDIVDTAMAPPCTSYPNCANGNPQREYIEISATLTRASVIPNSGLVLPATFLAKSIIRLN